MLNWFAATAKYTPFYFHLEKNKNKKTTDSMLQCLVVSFFLRQNHWWHKQCSLIFCQGLRVHRLFLFVSFMDEGTD